MMTPFKYIVPAATLACAAAAPINTEENSLEQHITQATRIVDLMAKANEKLATIKDTPSADAAAPELEELLKQMRAIKDENPVHANLLDEDMKSEAMIELNEKAERIFTEFSGHLMRIMQAGIKSEAFEKAMNQSVSNNEEADEKKDDKKQHGKEAEIIVEETKKSE